MPPLNENLYICIEIPCILVSSFRIIWLDRKLNFMFQIVLLTLCLIQSSYAAPSFLTISDIHYGSDNNSGADEDIGTEFLKITWDKLKQLSEQVNFILVLGDLPTHLFFVTPLKEEYERTVFHGLYEADQSLKPMFYITGNNDSLSGNYQPFELEGKSPLNFATDWTGACVHCDGLIIDNTYLRSDGYYSSYVMPDNKDIILIALNTVQWVKLPIISPQHPNQERDASKQLIWLEQQLKKHHSKQLLIAMHIPPGNAYTGNVFWQKEYLQKFITLLENNHHLYGQITLLTAHTHMDELRKINFEDRSSLYVYATPAISRIHRNNPGIKIFTLDKNLAMKNYTTYYTTSLSEWGNEQYQALGSPDAIFPNCVNKNLSQCLTNLSDDQVCNYLEQGLFYGVKSPRVHKNVCNKTYRVHSD